MPAWTGRAARRAGHGVAVLLKIYAHCIDGQADAASMRITDALGTQDAEQDPGTGRLLPRRRKEIRNWASQKPASHKVPERIRIVQAVPRNALTKTDRAAITGALTIPKKESV
jgi:acyl-coenzyme A synthetase/AMP-(fatty) acid ligase